jgi:outer membrane lipoprotein-sorting protein
MFILVTAFSSLTLFGQTKLSPEQQKQMVEKIDKTASVMTAMQCEFVQTKSMKLLSKEMHSKGIMYFKRPNKLRWQYITPYDYTFILNGDKVHIKSSKSTKNIDVQGNKMFRQITNIILNSVTGGNLNSSTDFNVEMYKKDNSYYAKLFPKKKELKQLYQVIEIYFDSSLTMVNRVRMLEKTGDETQVKLNNTKLNIAVDDKIFLAN